jgi:osmotically-inducible protein OsmY
VDHVLVSPESGRITHLVLRKGLLPYYPILPISAVRTVSEQALTVDLPDEQIEGLPRYRSRGPEDIEAELLDRMDGLGFNLNQIDVSAEDGVVRLKGWVPHVAAKRHAEAIARSMEGVIDVENELDTDVAIESRVMHALLSDPRTDISVIEVRNSDGVVTLKGQVDSAEIKEAAEEIAASQPGVLSVTNSLEVGPDGDTEWLTARDLSIRRWAAPKGPIIE